MPFVTGIAGSGTGQYFTDENGNPILVRGDSVWGLPLMAGAAGGATTWQSDIDAYVSARAAQGFNSFIMVGVGNSHYSNGATNVNGATWDSVLPFVGGDPGTLTAAYWARVDYAIAAAAAQGMTVFLVPCPAYTFNDAGGPMNGKSDAQFGALGSAVGARYKTATNLVWLFGDDWNGFNGTAFDSLLTGIRGAGDTHLMSVEYEPESTSRHDLSTNTTQAWGIANAQWNLCYSYNAGYDAVEYAYTESSPLCVLSADGSYDGDTYITQTMRDYFRNRVWWSLTSGSRGLIYGRIAIWPWATTSLAALTTNTFDNSDLNTIWNAYSALSGWHQLIPDTSSALVTAGRGTHLAQLASFSTYAGGNTYVSASKTADGKLAVIYIPGGGTITVSPAGLATGYGAKWLDPVSGATSTATIGATYTTPGTNSAGKNDWVLVLATPPYATWTVP